MPTKRQRVPRSVASGRLTPEVCAAWAAGDKHLLHRLLQIYPFDWSPFVVDDGPPPEWTHNRGGSAMNAASWFRAQAWRAALIAAAGQPGKHDRHGRPLRTSPPPG